ncbi:MAG: glucoamylase family protein [Candidatus Hydrogenedentota bacterium]
MRRLLVISVIFAAGAAGAWLWNQRSVSVERPVDVELDEVQAAAFRFFWENCDPNKGLVLDRSNNFQKAALTYSPSSVASTGFGLASLAVAAERGFVPRADAERRALATLRTMRDMVRHEHGFFYHFVDPVSGERAWNCELSPIDSVLFFAGALAAGSYFGGDVEKIARSLYERADWPWMLDGDSTFAIGWKPEKGFLPGRWDHYDEASLMYLLAIGSPTHPIPAGCWKKVRREIGVYKDQVCLVSGPLFTHQYSHLYVDFRGVSDGIADYWKSSVAATLANRAFCIDNAKEYPTYGENSWGITACDGPGGYKAYGAPPGKAIHDGTVAPTAALGSYQFTPELSHAALRHLRAIPGLWGLYGFADAYNARNNWIATDAIGIDQGALLLSIENARSGLLWRLVSSRAEIQRALSLAGFRKGSMEMKPTMTAAAVRTKSLSDRPDIRIPYSTTSPRIDGIIESAWDNSARIALDEGSREAGSSDNLQDASAEIRLLWNDLALLVLAEVKDSEIVARRRNTEIYSEDVIELYIDPQNNALTWSDPTDFQIGLAPRMDGNAWAWFQNCDPGTKGMVHAWRSDTAGYIIEAAIPWSFLGMTPKDGLEFGFSPALHDLDTTGSTEAKFCWFFLDPGIHIGKAILAK